MIRTFSLLTLAAIMTITSTPAFAGAADGVWLRSKTKAHIRAFNCRGGLGLKVIKSAKKKSVGKVIMCGAKKTGPNQWKGSLTSTEDGQTYTGYVKLKSKSRLTLSGCVLGGLICKNETWSRIR